MEQTILSPSEIDYLIREQESSLKIIKIFFLFWKAIGVIGIFGCILSMGQEILIANSIFEKGIMVFTIIIGVLIISGFFFGIPFLLEKSIKKTLNKIENKQYKVYIAKIVDKRKRRRNKKNVYYFSFLNGGKNIDAKVDHTTFESLNIGDDALIIDFGNGVTELCAYNRSLMM